MHDAIHALDAPAVFYVLYSLPLSSLSSSIVFPSFPTSSSSSLAYSTSSSLSPHFPSLLLSLPSYSLFIFYLVCFSSSSYLYSLHLLLLSSSISLPSSSSSSSSSSFFSLTPDPIPTRSQIPSV